MADESEFFSAETGRAVMSELIKAYGFRHEGGEWSWSAGNIARAFKEEPVWSTIDWLAVGVPMLKWGRAAKTVRTTGKLAGEMYRGGAFARKGRLTRGRLRRGVKGDRPAGRVEQFWEAMKYEEGLPRYGKTRRIMGQDVNLRGYMSTLMGRQVKPDDLGKYAASLDPHEWERLARGHTELLLRERRVYEAAVGSRASELVGQMDKLDEAERIEIGRLMGLPQGQKRYREKLSALSPEAQRVAERTMPFRNAIHNELFRTGAISKKTWRNWQRQYTPGLYDETFKGEIPEAVIGTKRGLQRAGDRLKGRMIGRDLMKEDKDTLRALWAKQRGVGIEDGVPNNKKVLARQIRDFDNAQKGQARLDWEIIADEIEGLSPILDPRVGLREIANMSSIVGARRFAESIAKSPLAVRATSEGDLLTKLAAKYGDNNASVFSEYVKLGSLVPGRDMKAAIAGNATVKKLKRGLAETNREIRRLERADKVKFKKAPISPEDTLVSKATGARRAERDIAVNVTDHAGIRKKVDRLRRKADDLVEQLGMAEQRAMQGGFFQNLPSSYHDTWVPKYVADQVDMVARLHDPNENFILRFVEAVNTTFKVGKTSYSPATHGRNFISGHIFYMLSTGDLNPSRTLAYSLKELRRSAKAQSDLIDEVRDMGLIGSTFSAEISDDLAHLYGGAKTDDLVVEYVKRLPGVGGLIRKAAHKGRSLYGYEDDLWKVAAYVRNKEKFLKAGLTPKLARERAFHETVKYFPMYNDTSAFTETVRRFVPFVSFTHESMRVWKNAMTWKPWAAVGIFNAAEMVTQASAAWMGFNDQDLERAKAMMPSYTKGKKMMMLPLASDDGTPFAFLDMSYHIPLADMGAEAEMMESAFFGVPAAVNPMAGFGLTSNPLISMAVAGTTGKDPFTQREVEPRFIEQQLGIDVPETVGGVPFRPGIGVVEHFFRQILPPIVPPGYHATNLLEKVRGQRSPSTGAELEEESWARTIATNMLGFRTYRPSEASAQGQFRQQSERLGRRVRSAWKQFDWAMAQGEYERAFAAENSALHAKYEMEFAELQQNALLRNRPWAPKRWQRIAYRRAAKYVREQMKKRAPGRRPTPLVGKDARKAAKEAAEQMGGRKVDARAGRLRMREYRKARRRLAEGG